jgi:hypothetical protein
MDCKEFEKRIPDFIADRMDYETLKQFGEHMKRCAECREELVIQFLVSEGISRLEEGDAFDLQKELDIRLKAAAKKLELFGRFLHAGYAFEIIGACLLIAIAILLFV